MEQDKEPELYGFVAYRICRNIEKQIVPVEFEQWKQHAVLQYLLIPRTIHRVRQWKDSLSGYEAQFFRPTESGKVLNKEDFVLETRTVPRGLLEWMFTDRALGLMDACNPQNADGWINVGQEQFFRAIAEPMIVESIRPRADGGLDCKGLDSYGDGNFVSFADENDFLDAAESEVVRERLTNALAHMRANQEHSFLCLGAGQGIGFQCQVDLDYEFAEPPTKIPFQGPHHECLPRSFLSAISYVDGFEKRAKPALKSVLYHSGKRMQQEKSFRNYDNDLRGDIVKSLKGTQFMKWEGQFDPFHYDYDLPVLVRFNGIPFCVTLFDGKIFVASLPNALKLSKKNMELICGGPGKYRGIKWAFKIVRTA